MITDIGPLNEVGRFEYKVVTEDAELQTDVDAWTLLGVRYCAILDDLAGRAESVRENVEVAMNASRLRTRYCTDITSGMRLIVNRPTPTIFNIISGPAIIGNKMGL